MSTILRRALLYVPGSNARMLEKSKALKVDCISYDLEDSVTPALKSLARENIRKLLLTPRPEGVRERAVRINSVGSGLAEEDLRVVLQAGGSVDTIVVPKVEGPGDIKFISDILTHHESLLLTTPSSKPIQILALIESARSLLSLPKICSPHHTSSTRLSGLIFAAEDYALDLNLTRTPSLLEMLYARQSLVTAAAAHKLSAIDLVCTDYKDTGEGGPLARECRDGVGMGFTGKQVIHPSQVAVCEELFRPAWERVVWAVRVVVASEVAEREGRGAWTLDGRMIDAPVVGIARLVVKNAELAGMDTQSLREKYRDVVPE
ncbi:citrate lyase subunit beta [Peziza echinospora]|nr:citrate lyase subunit beta [Peziza echinospora]